MEENQWDGTLFHTRKRHTGREREEVREREEGGFLDTQKNAFVLAKDGKEKKENKYNTSDLMEKRLVW